MKPWASALALAFSSRDRSSSTWEMRSLPACSLQVHWSTQAKWLYRNSAILRRYVKIPLFVNILFVPSAYLTWSDTLLGPTNCSMIVTQRCFAPEAEALPRTPAPCPFSRWWNSRRKLSKSIRSGRPPFRISSAETTPPSTICSLVSSALNSPGMLWGFGLMQRTKRTPPASRAPSSSLSWPTNRSPTVSLDLVDSSPEKGECGVFFVEALSTAARCS
mmetsp:Transcript_42908/g.121399  ORF Transcript_42908/g.121399 Transcript_42908/m.121399 type:complete len:218 (+) Transcript_42908:1478-2131(+)